uniref:Uncharacterized protein n=1 Tax=Anguilla anguilla TaxID=7936 RepID=A0A0E9TKH8_ANGAN
MSADIFRCPCASKRWELL